MASTADYIERQKAATEAAEREARAILDDAYAEGRDLTPTEERAFSEILGRVDRYKARTDELERRAGAERLTYEHRALLGATQLEKTSMNEDAERLAEGVRMAARGLSVETMEFETRALAKFSDSSSTVAEPEFASRFAFYARTLNPTVRVATVINSTSGESVTLPKMTSDITVYTPGEGTAITPSDPTLSASTLTVTSYKTLTLVSQELAQDNAINLMEIIARSAGRALGLSAGTGFTTGTSGFITLGTNGGTATTGNTPFFKVDDLISLYYGTPEPNRSIGSWMVSNSAVLKMHQAVTTTGEYLWQPSLQLGQPDTFLGRPVYENPAMAAVASASKSVAFGDFSAYVIKELPLRVDISRDYLFNTDQIAVKCVLRTGGTLPDTSAIRYLVSLNA